MRTYIIIGAGGHAAVVADILQKCGCPLKGYLDDSVAVGTEVMGSQVLGRVADCRNYPECLFLIGIGDNYARRKIAETYALDYGTAIHPASVIAGHVPIGLGSVIMAGSIINARASIGKHCIINSGAIIEHDNEIADYVHISPRAVTGGAVKVGTLAHIGIGATVKNNIAVAQSCRIGAGATVVKDTAAGGVYVGTPAKRV